MFVQGAQQAARAERVFGGAVRAAALFALILLPATARSQRVQSAVDGGAISVRYADSISATAAFLASSLALTSGNVATRARASLTQFAQGSWAAQGGLNGSLYSSRLGPLFGELSGAAAGSVHRGGNGSGEIRGGARLHISSHTLGAWIGGGAGRTWSSGTASPILLGDAGLWARSGESSLALFVNPFRVNDSTRYTDLQAVAAFNIGTLQLAAGLGMRSGDQLPVLAGAATTWWNGSATLRLSRWLSLVAGAGTYPVDYTQGFPGGRYASIGIRVPSLSAPDASPAPVVENEDWRRAVDAGISSFSLRKVRNGQYELRVRSSSATQIEIAGDFSDWRPQALVKKRGDLWSISLPLKPGNYQVNLRVQGGPWLVPPGLLVLRDEFGGAAGLLVVAGDK